MPTVTTTRDRVRDQVRDQAAPTLHKAQETLTETVLPAVVAALATAKEKGVELLDSDAALEAKRRSAAVVRAARGDAVVVAATRGRRFRFGFGMLALGAGIGYAISYAAKRLSTPVESYTHTLSPAPSGTVSSGASAGSPDGTSSTQDIDLGAGAPTNT
jgi:hypothetical protein